MEILRVFFFKVNTVDDIADIKTPETDWSENLN